jgi:translation initiation factor 4E transporter
MLFGGFDGTNCNLQDAASVQLQQRQSAATQQQKMQQKVYQQQQLLFQQQQQQQQVLSDKQLLTLIKQSPGCVGSGGGAGSGMLAGHLVASGAVLLPNSLQTQVSPHQQQQQAVHKPQHLQSYSPRGPSPVMFGSQPPLNITAPMPIHSRQRSPFGSAQLPQQPAAAVGPAAAAHPHPPSSSASLDLAYMQSLIQKQRQEQQRCQQLQHSDRSTLVQNFAPSAAVAMDNNSVSSIINVNKTTLPAFIPTSVIRQMLTAKADEKLTKEGDMVSVGGKRIPGKDVGGSDLTDADHVSGSASAIGHFNCVSTDSQHHYSSSVTTISPDSHQQPFSAAAAARRLVGQGSGPPASAVGYQPDAIQPPPQAGPLPLFGQGPLQQLQQQAPVGRPIVKGQLPYGAAASAVPSATSSHLSNQTSADQLRMHQFINQLRASSGTASQIGMMAAGGDGRMLTSAPPPTLMSPFMGPPPLQSVNQATANSALLLQHMHRAAQQQQQLTPQGFIGQQPMPSRVLRQAPLDGTTAQQPIVNVDGTSPIATGSGSVDISRWFDSRVYGHRLPNMPGQKVMTVDELECAPPTAN